MSNTNKIKLIFPSLSENESFARNVISCFSLKLNPSVSDIADIKTAVSEAFTNSIVHGYPDSVGDVVMTAEISGNDVHITIADCGIGIEDVDKAIEPFYTTKPNDERSGMGFTIIKTFMDDVKVVSKINCGTKIEMIKTISKQAV